MLAIYAQVSVRLVADVHMAVTMLTDVEPNNSFSPTIVMRGNL
jgi:hypothetical protein